MKLIPYVFHKKSTSKKLKSLTLTEFLVVMVIGILTFLAVPKLLPLITKAKSQEAKNNLKFIQSLQKTYKYENSKYAKTLEDLNFEIEQADDEESNTSD